MLISFAACGEKQETKTQEKTESKIENSTDKINVSYLGNTYNPGDVIVVDNVSFLSVLINGDGSTNAAPFSFLTDSTNELNIVKKGERALSFDIAKIGSTTFTISTATTSAEFTITNINSELAQKINEKNNNSEDNPKKEPTEDESNSSEGSVAKFLYDEVVAKYGNELTLSSVIAMSNKEHQANNAGAADYSKVQNYLKHTNTSITKTEVDLITNSGAWKSSITIDEAVADMKLFFKLMKYWYGAYYYFGEDKFVAAEEEILSTLNELDKDAKIASKDLSALLIQSLDFIVDGHLRINQQSFLTTKNMYRYYYCDLVLFKDSTGYYTVIDDVKWYYNSCNNKSVSVDVQLLPDGSLTYSIIQYAVSSKAHKSDPVVFVNEAGKKEVVVNWTLSTDYKKKSSIDYQFLEENGIYYVAVRNYTIGNEEATLKQSVIDAAKIKNAKVIIFDTRSHGGGDAYRDKWLQAVFGGVPTYSRYQVSWQTYPRLEFDTGRYSGNAQWGNEKYSQQKVNGNWIKNNIPVIVLTDHNSASGGDGIIRCMKSVENCVIVGSNTKGYESTFYPRDGYLPNSGIGIHCMGGMNFYENSEFSEGKGVQPDIWCNPETALESVINMLVKNNIGDASSLKSLFAQIGHK